MIPVFDIWFSSLDEFYFLLRVIDECTQLPAFFVTDVTGKKFRDLTFNITRGVLQHMQESLTFAMQVSKEMLCTLWKIEDCLQVDDFCRCSCYRREGVGKQLQVVHITAQVSSSLVHILR